jgi:hypothetical protein
MPAIASGLLKTTVYKKQSGLGSAASGSGGTVARRVTSIFKADRDMFASNEIVTHHQSTGSAYGLQKADGNINGLLSAGTFASLIGSILEKDFATGVNSTALTITYGGTTGAWTAARASGSFLTDGFKVGDVIRASGGSVSANNARNFWVTSVVALTITFRALDGVTVTAGSSTTTTLTVTGKKTHAPTTSHTKDYYTVEEWYSDLSRSETFTDCRVAAVNIALPATGNATVSVDMVGLNRTLGNAQVLTTPTTTTTAIMSAINGEIIVNGAVQAVATGLTVSISNSAANAGAVIGSNVGADVTTGRIMVSGTLTAQFDSTTLQALYAAETNIGINLVLTGDNTGTADFIAISLPRVKLTGDAPDDGEKAIIRSYPFTAEYNAGGGTGIATEQTICSVQDSAA